MPVFVYLALTPRGIKGRSDYIRPCDRFAGVCPRSRLAFVPSGAPFDTRLEAIVTITLRSRTPTVPRREYTVRTVPEPARLTPCRFLAEENGG